MNSPELTYQNLKKKIKPEWKLAFESVLIIGLISHITVMLGDYPNHDGLASMYFDQNMITSGRWFLTIACGISSYFTLPWLIGLLSLVFLGTGAIALVEFLELKNRPAIVLVTGLLVSFPALASTFTYIFTADGYMMALGLIFISVYLAKQSAEGKIKAGWLWGGVCLAFSMGTYQSYLAFAILLSIYGCMMICFEQESVKKKLLSMLHYLYMGVLGVGLYYVLLQILLKIQGKELDTYQGINGMAASSDLGIAGLCKTAYGDFLAFTGKGNVLFNNLFSLAALTALSCCAVYVLSRMTVERKWYKSLQFYICAVLILAVLPLASNMILFISPNVTYHLLMRYQYVLYPILFLTIVVQYGKKDMILQWIAGVAAFILLMNFVVTDQIAYSNLQKKYEKTYAYCLRMVDRMEQTDGYYQGIPIAMIGVINQENLPETDITKEVTRTMIGMSGDYLIYTDTNYQSFMKNYLGVTINLVDDEEMVRIYDTPEYQALNSFPQEESMKVVDGVLYIKTE